MSKPLLQVALDALSLPEALEAVRELGHEVDVIEAGTILCFAEGTKAVANLRALFPEKIILADLKAADAGAVLAEMVFSAGASWMTVICNAPPATKEKALEVARKYQGDIQVELYGSWTFEDAAEWKASGITQVIYHRGRDAEAAGQKWSEVDLAKIRKLAEMGMDVSVTGGLDIDSISLFKGIPVKAFIAGRNLCKCDNPAQMARDFKAEISKFW
ncbi:3-keto-L-gulonate-6-phosphate decarboxylase UlaD [Lentisphaerota bacterium ZTH]|nr:3-keto-L-gulonate-6-phosphate decarboxylase UlaD [Lentisphaerota bacterium]WET05353.1 3-keto-L-gulonate-6-phosphate decarboxylase UlaD [Lentisphaerota bacterium ZTH]